MTKQSLRKGESLNGSFLALHVWLQEEYQQKEKSNSSY